AMIEMLARLRALNPRVHLPLAIQIAHAGRKASSHAPWDGGQQIPLADGGWTACAPSALAHQSTELAPTALDQAGLDALKHKFVQCTQRAARIGFDAAEMHAAHGYLMHQFLSPIANQRSDEYGGSLENRMRWPLEVFSAMRAVWPDDKPLGVRISATDWDEQSSWDINESTVFAKACEAAGADWIDVSSGGVSTAQKIALGPGYQVPFAQAIKQAVSIPVMAVGLITEASQAEQIVANGHADMVALARALLYNPRWVWHAAHELGAAIDAPVQYWRSEPREARGLFGETSTGQR
ncbi:MAG: tRNA-dihydrouridine synthase, partial [Burkholderiaceae bacterium]